MLTGMASGLTKQLTKGVKMGLQNLGVIDNNKRNKQMNEVKKVLSSLTYQQILPQGQHYLDLGTGQRS